MGTGKREISPGSEQDSDEDAPEIITASQSKAIAREKEQALKASDAKIKQRRKEANRLRDQNLKRRAEETKGLSTKRAKFSKEGLITRSKLDFNDGDGEMSRAEERMRKAMLEAEDESNDEDDEDFDRPKHDLENESDSSDGDDMEGFEGLYNASDENIFEDGTLLLLYFTVSILISRLLVDDETTDRIVIAPKEDYLPDDVFTAALKAPRQSKKSEADLSKGSLPSAQSEKKRKKRRQKAKDFIVGYVSICHLQLISYINIKWSKYRL